MKLINIFAGPGSGKTSFATGLFSALKFRDKNCEFVGEFAKELVWGKQFDALEQQWYVTGTQLYRIKRLEKHVDYVVTDSPILLGAVYAKDYCKNPHLRDSIIWEHNQFDNFNIFLNRRKPYLHVGRIQTETEAIEKDNEVLELLKDVGAPFIIVDGTSACIEEAVRIILG